MMAQTTQSNVTLTELAIDDVTTTHHERVDFFGSQVQNHLFAGIEATRERKYEMDSQASLSGTKRFNANQDYAFVKDNPPGLLVNQACQMHQHEQSHKRLWDDESHYDPSKELKMDLFLRFWQDLLKYLGLV